MTAHYDVVIVGGGHNGLVAAGYLAKANKRVLVLEKENVFGGAAISAQAFKGIEAHLSRYSYLVSLLPEQIIQDLDLDVQLAPRRFGSYTPEPTGVNGLLVDKEDPEATRRSFCELGVEKDFYAWQSFYAKTEIIAKKLFPTVLQPLATASEIREELGESLWREFFEQPIGQTIEEHFSSDLVRGVVMTDALIGTFASNLDANLNANRCFLYHVIGNSTGEWNIPVGGMGSVTSAMAKSAKHFGAVLRSDAEVLDVSEDGAVTYHQRGQTETVSADLVLANVSKPTLAKLMKRPAENTILGSQAKINMLLSRLPKLKSGIEAKEAFGGTLHINENYSQLQIAFEQASAGDLPNPLPLEIYCHSLTDSSILGESLRASGAQTLTVFTLHTPHSLVTRANNDAMRKAIQDAAIESINSVLAEDIRQLLLVDADGQPCIETKTTLDLEDALGLPGGNIFHAPLSWPFLPDNAKRDTPATKWGVASDFEKIFFCGSTAVRGGAVSGIGGHNAAMAVLETLSAR